MPVPARRGQTKADQADLATWVRSVLGGAFDRRLLATFEEEGREPWDWISSVLIKPPGALGEVARRRGKGGGNLRSVGGLEPTHQREGADGAIRIVFRDQSKADPTGSMLNVAAYSPSRALRHVAAVDLTKRRSSPDENSLAFESTVQNKFVQSWLLSLYSKRAIARERQQSGDQYTRSLDRFENALRLLYGQDVSFDVEIEPSFQPRLKAFGHNLDFSQLPDGVRSTVGWVADFMMRQDLVHWDVLLRDKRPGVLLDEVDAHLHPLWQRQLLPAMREALPDVQILVTSHSPFVISSCPNSRVHVLELDASGRAHTRPPVNSPIGESVTTTLKEIFGVDSRFDVLTERELDEWNTLKRGEVAASLSASDRSRLTELTETLADRSEELRSIVASPLTIPVCCDR